MIFEILGTPTEKDLTFVSDDKALEYLKSFPKKTKKKFSDMFSAASGDALDFLEKTLQFNPDKRISIDECLEHPLFSEVRDKSVEVFDVKELTFGFEDEEIDTEARLRELFVKEIKYYHPDL